VKRWSLRGRMERACPERGLRGAVGHHGALNDLHAEPVLRIAGALCVLIATLHMPS